MQGAVEMHKISVELNEKRGKYPDTDKDEIEYWRQMKLDYPAISRSKLGWIKDNVQELKARCINLGLSYYGANIAGARKIGQGRNTGARAQKNMDADPVHQVTMMTRAWHEQERRMGHDVDKVDIFNDFMDRCEFTYKLMQKRGDQITKDGQVWANQEKEFCQKLKTRWESLSAGGQDLIKSFTTRLLAKMRAKVSTPSRSASLNANEELVRCEETWKSFDYVMWLAAFADKELLSKYVADPESFIARRAQTWLLFSDQIPFWVKIGKRKIVTAEFETVSKKRRKLMASCRGSQGAQESQKVENEGDAPLDGGSIKAHDLSS